MESRDEKITFLIKAIDFIEGVLLEADYFEKYSDEQLDDEVAWMDYLLGK